jgi:3-oxoacyl-[acyl-carrier protein] reductase
VTAPKVVVVTGARGGIGRAIVDCVAASGATVVAADLAPGTHTADRVHAATVDVLDDGSVAEVLDLAAGLGTVAGVVNCAGVLVETPIGDLDGTGAEAMLAVNLLGAMRVVRHAAPHLGRGSAIVNISSIAAAGGSAPAVSGYAASKGGLEAYTRATACELGPSGVRVNAVAPGIIRAPMAGLLLDAPGGEDRVLRRVPLGRLGEPRDIAEVVAFLLSERSAYVTGAVVTVDGGIRAT